MSGQMIQVNEASYEDLKHRYYISLVRGDRLGEENKRLKEHNEALRIIEHCALCYCEAASEGLPAPKLDKLFTALVAALGWRREAKERKD